MEAKINVAEILKDKPENTKLYSPLFGDVYFSFIGADFVTVKHHGTSADYQLNAKLYDYDEAEPSLFPSKSMRDWSKFAWKKGDVLVGKDNVHVIFEKFENDDYTRFKGKYYLWEVYAKEDNSEDVPRMPTSSFEKANDYEAQTYINTIEERLGGKLNLETLEIEKTQPEFKDGIFSPFLVLLYQKNHIFIFSKFNKYKDFEHHVALTASGKITTPTSHGAWCRKDSGVKYATEEEKQQLFEALAKENKAWDAEKKQIVDLKQKWTPKPFDRVITRVNNDVIWTANIFSHIDRHGKYVTIGCISGYRHCIPYNEETAKLIGTTNNWEG